MEYKSNLTAFCEISKITFASIYNLIFPYAKDDNAENPTRITIKSSKISLKMVFRQAYNMKQFKGKITFNIEVINLDKKISKSKITLLVKLNNNINVSICKLLNSIQSRDIESILGVFLCEIESSISYYTNNINITLIDSDYIAGINNNVVSHRKISGDIPVQFTINKIIDNNKNQKSFILKGVTSSDISENINFSHFISFYNKQASCILPSTSKLIQT